MAQQTSGTGPCHRAAQCELKLSAHVHDVTHDGLAYTVKVNIADQRHIQLDQIRLKIRQQVKTGIACAAVEEAEICG